MPTITKETGISIGLLIVIITGIMYLANLKSCLEKQLSNMAMDLNMHSTVVEYRLSSIEASLQRDLWTGTHMQDYSLQLRRFMEGLNGEFPSPRRIQAEYSGNL